MRGTIKPDEKQRRWREWVAEVEEGEEEIMGGWKIYRYKDAKDSDKRTEEEETDESHRTEKWTASLTERLPYLGRIFLADVFADS